MKETKQYLIRDLTCVYCTNTVLTKEKGAARFAGVLSCDGYPECIHGDRDINEGNYFYGCKNCDTYDLCHYCYDNFKAEVDAANG